jgi:hypothetical protein
MDLQSSDKSFLEALPVFDEFEGVADLDKYRPVPDGWMLATADIVGSTKAIADGRYKAVNTAGASVISALVNELDRNDLPFVFGGDGALVALPGSMIDAARKALAAVQAWVSDELDLSLRAAVVPVADIRQRGLDVRVARVKASDLVSYAMFSGGGSSWAEAEMKAGRYRIEPAPAGTRPDLTGLSCRWDPIESRSGEIVSIIALPRSPDKLPAFAKLVADIVALAGEQGRGGHPVPVDGPGYSFPPKGLDLEARASAPPGWRRLLAKAIVLAQLAMTSIADRFNATVAGFNPKQYKSDVAQNSDFRKFDDGLKMTVDIDAGVLQRIEKRLQEAERSGICSYGLHRQDSALMTCIVANPMQRDHIHFVDGAAGGYAVAAANMKAKLPA